MDSAIKTGRGEGVSFNHRSPRRWGWETKNCGDSTVPRDPTGRAYCTEVGVGQKRALLGWPEGTEAGQGDTSSALEAPQSLTVQFTRCPRWGDSGRWREQDMGHRMGSHKNIYRFFFFERVSGRLCTPAPSASTFQVRHASRVHASLWAPRCWDGPWSACGSVSSAH